MDERKNGKRDPIDRKESGQLKVIWECDKNLPKEERQRRVDQVFEVLLNEESCDQARTGR